MRHSTSGGPGMEWCRKPELRPAHAADNSCFLSKSEAQGEKVQGSGLRNHPPANPRGSKIYAWINPMYRYMDKDAISIMFLQRRVRSTELNTNQP